MQAPVWRTANRLADGLASALVNRRRNLMKTVYHAASPLDAQLVVDWLAAEGIDAHVQGNYLSGAIGELPIGEMVRVWVADDDEAAARACLAEREAQNSAEGDDWDEADVEAEVKEASPGSATAAPVVTGGRGWIGLAVGLLLGAGLTYWRMHVPVQVDELDYDHNNLVDSRETYEGEVLKKIVDDRNGDSKPDQITLNPWSGAAEVQVDDDFDGRFEGVMIYKKNLLNSYAVDDDGDGFFEQRSDYVDGVIWRDQYLDPRDSSVFKQRLYVHGVLDTEEMDRDRDGILEIKRKFDRIGEVIPSDTVAP